MTRFAQSLERTEMPTDPAPDRRWSIGKKARSLDLSGETLRIHPRHTPRAMRVFGDLMIEGRFVYEAICWYTS